MKYPTPPTTFIYAICNENDSVVYIGKSNKPIFRFRQHKSWARHKKLCIRFKLQWLKEILSKTKTPNMIILKEVSYEEWEYWEKYYIDYYTNLGQHLYNISKGGLEWSANARRAVIKYWSNPILQYSLEGIFVKEWESSAAAARFYNVSSKVIQRVVRGGRKSSVNYMWRIKRNDNYPLIIDKIFREK